jgi:hypothetical protein
MDFFIIIEHVYKSLRCKEIELFMCYRSYSFTGPFTRGGESFAPKCARSKALTSDGHVYIENT